MLLEMCRRSGVLLRGLLPRTSEKAPSETVWKIGMGSEIGFRRPQRGAQRASIGRLLPPKQHAREAYGYFPNSFSTHSGELGREEGSKRGGPVDEYRKMFCRCAC